jgi:hypothetical protein
MDAIFKKPAFGKVTERSSHPDGPDDIVERHYRHNTEVLAVHSREETIAVEDKSSAYAVIARGLDVLDNASINRVVFEVEKNLKTGELRRVVQRYEVKRESR